MTLRISNGTISHVTVSRRCQWKTRKCTAPLPATPRPYAIIPMGTVGDSVPPSTRAAVPVPPESDSSAGIISSCRHSSLLDSYSRPKRLFFPGSLSPPLYSGNPLRQLRVGFHHTGRADSSPPPPELLPPPGVFFRPTLAASFLPRYTHSLKVRTYRSPSRPPKTPTPGGGQPDSQLSSHPPQGVISHRWNHILCGDENKPSGRLPIAFTGPSRGMSTTPRS